MNYIMIGIGLCSFVSGSLFGYSYEIKALRKLNPQTKRYHYVIGVCDFHDKSHPVNEVQRKKIEESLQSHEKDKIYVIAEDLSSSKDNKLIAGSFYINATTGILASLCNYCAQNRIPFSNAEYRYCRVAALGPIINNLQINPTTFPSARKITMGMLKQEIEMAIYDLSHSMKMNASIFASEYVLKIKKIQNAMKKMQFDEHSSTSVADYMNASSHSMNRLEVIKHLLTFDGCLVGFNIAQNAYKNFDKEKVVCFAGGTHINEAYDLLQKYGGYEKVTTTQLSIFKEHNLQKCLGANVVNGSFCLKPHPISLELLEHYLKN